MFLLNHFVSFNLQTLLSFFLFVFYTHLLMTLTSNTPHVHPPIYTHINEAYRQYTSCIPTYLHACIRHIPMHKRTQTAYIWIAQIRHNVSANTYTWHIILLKYAKRHQDMSSSSYGYSRTPQLIWRLPSMAKCNMKHGQLSSWWNCLPKYLWSTLN